jgi:hypothetical protein
MLAKCANPACSTPFRYLETGTLFRLENDPWCSSSDNRSREYYWLCRGCSATLSLRLDDAARIKVAPLGEAARRGVDGFDFILLDRQKGMLLSRMILFDKRPRRRERSQGGQLHL